MVASARLASLLCSNIVSVVGEPVIGASPEVATEIRDLVLHPPANPYNVLKKTLIKRTAASEQKRLQQKAHTTFATNAAAAG
jgi:hypothetical protein